jgi:hypothetical protein
MNGGLIILLTFIITIITSIAIRYFLWTLKVKDQNSIAKDWEDFERAITNHDMVQIKLIGEKLVWNTSLEKVQLKKMIKIVDQNIDRNSELEKLRLDLFNKKLNSNLKIINYNDDL